MGNILTQFFAYLIKWINYAADYVAGVVAGSFTVLFGFFRHLFYSITNVLFDALDVLLNGSQIAQYLAVLSSNYSGPLGYFLDLFMVPQALTALGTAYLLRFAIRRLPVVG